MTTLTRRSAEELRELAAQGAALLAGGREATAQEAVAWVARTFAPDAVAVACSMADAVLPHLVSQEVPGVDVLFLDTGYHFAETRGTRDAVEVTMPVTVVDVRPRLSVAEQDAEHGPRLHDRDPVACCRMRKMEPLAAQLAQYEVWLTGVRRDEGPTRASTPLVDFDERHGLVKVNPLAAWTFDDVLDHAQANGVLLNPLLTEGYPSIGCAPCTRAVAPGEDPRAGRWAGFAKTECGIHE